MEIERGVWGALEKYHNMEDVQLKKRPPPSVVHTALIVAPSLHLGLQTKGYDKKSRKTRQMSILTRNFAFRYIIWVFFLKGLFNDNFFIFSIFLKK